MNKLSTAQNNPRRLDFYSALCTLCIAWLRLPLLLIFYFSLFLSLFLCHSWLLLFLPYCGIETSYNGFTVLPAIKWAPLYLAAVGNWCCQQPLGILRLSLHTPLHRPRQSHLDFRSRTSAQFSSGLVVFGQVLEVFTGRCNVTASSIRG